MGNWSREFIRTVTVTGVNDRKANAKNAVKPLISTSPTGEDWEGKINILKKTRLD